jgi:hypothetical protein
MRKDEFIAKVKEFISNKHGCSDIKEDFTIEADGSEILTITWVNSNSRFGNLITPKIIIKDINSKQFTSLNEEGQAYWADFTKDYNFIESNFNQASAPYFEINRKVIIRDGKGSIFGKRDWDNIEHDFSVRDEVRALLASHGERRYYSDSIYTKAMNSVLDAWDRVREGGQAWLNKLLSLCSPNKKVNATDVRASTALNSGVVKVSNNSSVSVTNSTLIAASTIKAQEENSINVDSKLR